jgi:hypothetical protein
MSISLEGRGPWQVQKKDECVGGEVRDGHISRKTEGGGCKIGKYVHGQKKVKTEGFFTRLKKTICMIERHEDQRQRVNSRELGAP